MRIVPILAIASLLGVPTTAMATGEMPDFLKESAGIIQNLSVTVASSREWLASVKARNLNLSYNEGRVIDLAIAVVRMDIDKMEERATAFPDPEISGMRLALLVHITSDIYKVQFGLREVQALLEGCSTCDEAGLALAATWAAMANPILQSLEESSEKMRKSSAGAVHDVGRQLESCHEGSDRKK